MVWVMEWVDLFNFDSGDDNVINSNESSRIIEVELFQSMTCILSPELKLERYIC